MPKDDQLKKESDIIWIILFLSFFVLCMVIVGVITTARWVGSRFETHSHVYIQRGESQPYEKYHRFAYDKTFLPGMDDTLVLENDQSQITDDKILRRLKLQNEEYTRDLRGDTTKHKHTKK